MTGTKIWRLSLAAILTFGWLFLIPSNAYATCVNYIQSQTIAAAYEGDVAPTVHEMDTCSGDDVSYQVPIATTITFDGVQYDRVYATTNSVITFGRPDNTYWDYPQTPSISLYSMDWYAGINAAPNGLDISYSEGGFQINLQAIPFGNWNAQASNINILVAITNTGGISVAYSYQGPQYNNLRTGVRLHNGSIVSLEAWGATQVQPGSSTPTLSADPVVVGPTQEQLAVQEEMRVTANLIANAIATANIQPEPSPSPSPVQTQTAEPTPTPTPQTTVSPEPTQSPSPVPTIEPSPEPSPQPTDTNPQPTPTPQPTPVEPSPEPSPSNTTIEPDPVVVEPEIITPDDSRFPDNIPTNDLLRQLSDLTNSNTLAKLSPEQKFAVAKSLGIKQDEIALVINIAKDNPTVAEALTSFADKAKENQNAPMPYTLADAVTEVQTEKLLADPIGALTNIDLEKVLSPSEWGKDMTDDQREKAQEVIVPVIIASNIIAASMTRRK